MTALSAAFTRDCGEKTRARFTSIAEQQRHRLRLRTGFVSIMQKYYCPFNSSTQCALSALLQRTSATATRPVADRPWQCHASASDIRYYYCVTLLPITTAHHCLPVSLPLSLPLSHPLTTPTSTRAQHAWLLMAHGTRVPRTEREGEKEVEKERKEIDIEEEMKRGGVRENERGRDWYTW